jgi:hypothetical protein
MKANGNFNTNSLRYPIGKRLGGPQSLSGHYGEEKILPSQDSNSNRQPLVQKVYRMQEPESDSNKSTGNRIQLQVNK